MAMTVGGPSCGAAMAAWQTQQRNIAANAQSAAPAPASGTQAVAASASAGADQQIAAIIDALATGSTFNIMA